MTATPHLSPPRDNARGAILSAAIDLFAEQGYGGASLHRVAEQAGVRKASSFHHFESKANLADPAFERVRQQFIVCFAPLRPGDPPSRAQRVAMIESAIGFAATHRSSARLGMRLFVDDLAGPAGARSTTPKESYVAIFEIRLASALAGAKSLPSCTTISGASSRATRRRPTRKRRREPKWRAGVSASLFCLCTSCFSCSAARASRDTAHRTVSPIAWIKPD